MTSVVSRVMKNLTLLVGSTGVSGVCAVVTLGFNTRALAAHDFGVLSLIQAYVALVAALTSFESWQPVVRLGIRMPEKLRLTLSSGLFLDFSAACGATVLAVAGVLAFGQLFGIAAQYQALAALYALSLLAGVGGTPKGYFRLRHDFKTLAGNQAALAIAMTVASIVLWRVDAQLETYVVVFAAIAAIYNLTLLVRMLVSLRQSGENLATPFRSKADRRHLKLMFRMATGNSLLSSLLLSRRHLALFVVGHLLGEASAGVYSVAARLVTVLSKFGLLLNQVLFSEIIKSAAEIDAAVWRQTILRVSAVAVVVAALAAILGLAFSEQLVALVSGAEYISAAPVFSLLLVAECIGLAGIHFNPVIQHRLGTVPLIRYSLISLGIFLILAVALSARIGISGAAVGVLMSSVAAYIMMASKVTWILRKRSNL